MKLPLLFMVLWTAANSSVGVYGGSLRDQNHGGENKDGSVEGLDRRLKTTQKEIPADEVTASHEPRRLGLGDWTVCKSSSECNNGCCSGTYSNGVLKCTPLNGGYRPDLCTSTATGGTCGNGNRGDGKCANGQCCSQYGWCGTSDAHCGSPPPTSGSTYTGAGSGTFYYDVTKRSCFGPPYAENKGYPTCTSHDPKYWKTLEAYGSNRIVAIDNRLLSTEEGRKKYCGKQIRVYKNGVEVSGGPFVVFDGCEACASKSLIDFSLSALDAIDNGQACNDGVVPGISWSVTNTQVIPFVA